MRVIIGGRAACEADGGRAPMATIECGGSGHVGNGDSSSVLSIYETIVSNGEGGIGRVLWTGLIICGKS